MEHKYLTDARRHTYPQLPAQVAGLDVGYAALVAGYGAVPATAVPTTGPATMALQLLEADMVAALDATETGYDRVRLTPDDGVTVTVGSMPLESVDVYVARGGFLADAHGPLLLGDTPGRWDQRALVRRLLGFVDVVPEDLDAWFAQRVRVPQDPAGTADAGQAAALLRRAIEVSGGAEESFALDEVVRIGLGVTAGGRADEDERDGARRR